MDEIRTWSFGPVRIGDGGFGGLELLFNKKEEMKFGIYRCISRYLMQEFNQPFSLHIESKYKIINSIIH